MRKKYILLVLFCCFFSKIYTQNTVTLTGLVTNQTQEPLENVLVQIPLIDQLIYTDKKGSFSVELVSGITYTFNLLEINSEPKEEFIFITRDTSITFTLNPTDYQLPEVHVGTATDAFGIRQLRAIENGGLYEGKKTEVINIEQLVSNKATNNARQAFGKIPSLTIWESDNAGLQLDIGGRGLSPKRTTNFNTRQNGYDMSADPLGYPESYYSPPLQAVKQIELVRGAGALQYGSQFGGMINFKLKEGNTKKKVNFETHNSYGANQFINTFNSLHGQVGKFNYYSYVQYKRGNGWRPNEDYDQVSAFFSGKYEISKKLKIGVDLTHMYYLSQQAGGLTDEVFETNPRSSNRERNWFKVNWNLAAVLLEYELSDQVKIYNRLFGLSARRTSLGLLETPDLPDPMSNRDLLDGSFNNYGNETRVAISYPFKSDLMNTLLVGTRIYKGKTNFSQKFGTDGSDSDFTEVDTSFIDRRKSDFDFPNTNLAIFAENIFRLSPTLSIIPGVRLEYIGTESNGYYTNSVRINAFGDFIEEIRQDSSKSNRTIFLYGVGLSNKFNDNYELYANATANYRAINFTDVQIQTNIQVVDPNIDDEDGYSFDIGLRKRNFSPFFIEAGLFYTIYGNRIGEVIDDGIRLRTNIGSARIYGAEFFGELDILSALNKSSNHRLSTFINGSINRGEYTKINERALVGVRSGNKLEDLPDYNIKVGVTYGYKNFTSAIQSTWVGKQYSDAANTQNSFQGVWGPVPAYHVVDLSGRYDFSDQIRLSFSINNLLNKSYFTRRAAAYPGPGIIPGLGRTWNCTLSVRL